MKRPPADASQPAPSISVSNDELVTLREAMRGLGALLERLETGRASKLVVTQENRIRAVIVTPERWAEIERYARATT
jgi:hypothetical protein